MGRNQEKRLGKMIFEQQTRLAASQGALYPPGHPYMQRVQRIGMQIAKVSSSYVKLVCAATSHARRRCGLLTWVNSSLLPHCVR